MSRTGCLDTQDEVQPRDGLLVPHKAEVLARGRTSRTQATREAGQEKARILRRHLMTSTQLHRDSNGWVVAGSRGGGLGLTAMGTGFILR